jgi:hypothetical protein
MKALERKVAMDKLPRSAREGERRQRVTALSAAELERGFVTNARHVGFVS